VTDRWITEYAAKRVSRDMFKKEHFRPPRLRTAIDTQRERHATWLELFYDLVFVAAISRLAGNLDRDYSLTGLLHVAVLFVPVWWAWIGQTFYLTRFDSDDLGHRLITMAQIMAVASLIVHVPDALGDSSTGFALSYAAVRFMLVAEYFRAARHIPYVRPIVNRYLAGFSPRSPPDSSTRNFLLTSRTFPSVLASLPSS
jgi:low temperature requirement protein LtrA